MTEERIIVSPTDEPTLVAEKLIDTDAKTVVFIISKDSEFAASKTNFKLLKREAEVLKKKVFIESSDEEVLKMAVASGLDTVDPVSVEPEEASEVVKVKISSPGRSGRQVTGPKKTLSSGETVEVSSRGTRRKKVTVTPIKNSEPQVQVDVAKEGESDEEDGFVGEPVRPKRKRIKISRRAALYMIVGAVVVAGACYLGLAVLPKAAVAIETKKEPWQFDQNIIADTSVSAVDPSSLKVPGQLFIQKSTVTTKQPASGQKYLERRSAGTLTIYNAYSSKPQGLVTNTRFVTPDGIVFRLISSVTVPGADIENGQVVASSITAPVAADKAGASGDVGPVSKLVIPGFAGTPKYQGFYGELKEGTTGGLVGQTKVPTESDMAAAKSASAKAVEAAVRNQAVSQIPDGFKTVDSATRFVITKQDVNQVVDAEGNFSVTTTGQLSALAFREKDILGLLHQQIQKDKGDAYQVDSETLSYGPISGTASPATGRLALPIEYVAELAQKIDVAAVRQQMKGQSEEGIKAIIYNLPGISSAKISLWPFWVRHVPIDENKITVTVQ